MSTHHQYWTLIRLAANGTGQPHELPQAKALLRQLCPQAEPDEDVGDRSLQRQLHAALKEALKTACSDPDSPDLGLAFHSPPSQCFRCYISHQALKVCRDLVKQFGANHGFTLTDLLPIVLNDDGKPLTGSYRPLSHKILSKFDPHSASLSTWATRLIRSSEDLNTFLKEHDILLISDWALLNSANPTKLTKALGDFHLLSAPEIEQSQQLLAAYHQVYRQERILKGDKGRCEDPTPDQCEAIRQHLPNRAITAIEVFQQLRRLAKRLRDYDLERYHGQPGNTVESIIETLAPSPAPEAEPEADLPWARLTEIYQAEFNACLTQAVKDVIEQRLQTLKPQQRQNYLQALRFFYCEGLKMGEIAPCIGLEKQYQVTRLLKLKPFRAEIRHRAIACLQLTLRQQFTALLTPDHLVQLDNNLEHHLGPEIDVIIETEVNQAQNRRQHRTKCNRLAEEICQILHHF